MEKRIKFYDWRIDLAHIAGVDSIGTDFILLDNTIIPTAFSHPFKIDVTVGIICMSGMTRGKMNLKPYTTQSPGFAVILPDQILEYEYISDDFSALIVVMSKRFTESLNIKQSLPLFLSIRDNPFIPLTKDELDAMVTHYSIMQRAVSKKENPYRLEVAESLIKAFFYSFGYQFHQLPENVTKAKGEILLDNFLKHVQTHYRNQRGVEFYAKGLCLTSKYLSKVVKEVSGQSANSWINNYVVLEAKALLKSTNLTIQQISDELNFPSQSFFGKYFKRYVGLSPKEYRNN